MPRVTSKITPCLWFDGQAEAAARFYTAIFPDSSIGEISHYTKGYPGVEGSVMTAEFTPAMRLAYRPFRGVLASGA